MDLKTVIVGNFADEIVAERVMLTSCLETGYYRKVGNEFVVFDSVDMSDIRPAVNPPVSRHIKS